MISTGHTAAEAEALPAGEPDGGSYAAILHLGSVTRDLAATGNRP